MDFEKFGNSKALIDTDDKLPDDIIIKKYCDINYMRY